MAGSYQHVDQGMSLIENMGDAQECIEELLYLVYAGIDDAHRNELLEAYQAFERGDRTPYDMTVEGSAFHRMKDRMNR